MNAPLEHINLKSSLDAIEFLSRSEHRVGVLDFVKEHVT